MAAIGRVLLMPKGTYSGSAIYNSLDWVRHNGAAWVCKLDGTTGIAPSTSATTNWQLMAEDGKITQQLLDDICATDVYNEKGVGCDNMSCILIQFKQNK